ncbi:GH1 family beta-glucosidase [Hyphomonas sp.]|uniref:GH1 family beta-glucosidase n=1 Tax=Hyphomonas sp. TaxID=87 RepID=UPI0025BA0076|nr:GH1 family beta-glucosidase [Hyphomonas sp.]MBI1399494.1 beta-glucosidase [Hyphomonas sp.]
MVQRSDFPESFVWGASTASYQIEGAFKDDGRGLSIWDAFSAEPGRVKNGDTGNVACDHYHRYKEDVALMKAAHFGAYRFSTSWSRVLPEGRGQPNEDGLDFYDRLTDELLRQGVAPWLCLYHWDLPLALHEAGLGWTNREIVPLFADYAGLMARRLGDRIVHWATFNEPNMFTMLGYGAGVHAPGIRDREAWLDAVHNVNLSHGAAVRRLRAELPASAQIGSVPNLQPALPATDTDEDRAAAAIMDSAMNRGTADPVFLGKYDPIMRGWLGDRVKSDDEADIHAPLDWLGLNHYSPTYASARANAFGFRNVDPPDGAETTLMGWHVQPGAFRDILVETSKRYGLPVYVTENGMADDVEPDAHGRVNDAARVAYLERYLGAVLEARAAGADVRGYLVWSMLDNFEWAMGYGPRFGIVHVDYKTLKRTPKASYRLLASLAGANHAT